MTDNAEFMARIMRADLTAGKSLAGACLSQILQAFAMYAAGDQNEQQTIDHVLDCVEAYTAVAAEVSHK